MLLISMFHVSNALGGPHYKESFGRETIAKAGGINSY